ncbi:PhzF family phenazine biosynthesis protein [Microbacterium sp. 2FI]|uniref:PhzF family phenazine biosynthesis protein n=1 Tax=Microbacterium sp. 2FI TaxID=2502193 RepID=UPI0010F63BFF|nr:PhzF family phenazine biosynthesis protein [Microbacterium sp. 2FI]
MNLFVNVVNVFVDDVGAHGNPLGIVWASSATRKREQQIAADLGFSETIFIDGVADRVATARIFTPTRELPFAGHPTVGLAAWLRRGGDEVKALSVPAGSVRVRADGDMVFVTALPEWAPEFALDQLSSPTEVKAVDPDAYGVGLNYVWAWLDEPAGKVHARMFAADLGIREDEATGSAAVRLSSHLGRDLEIQQGEGSLLRTHVRYLGQQIEVGGRVSEARITELR